MRVQEDPGLLTPHLTTRLPGGDSARQSAQEGSGEGKPSPLDSRSPLCSSKATNHLGLAALPGVRGLRAAVSRDASASRGRGTASPGLPGPWSSRMGPSQPPLSFLLEKLPFLPLRDKAHRQAAPLCPHRAGQKPQPHSRLRRAAIG